jgi:hypothetical protein
MKRVPGLKPLRLRLDFTGLKPGASTLAGIGMWAGSETMEGGRFRGLTSHFPTLSQTARKDGAPFFRARAGKKQILRRYASQDDSAFVVSWRICL